MKLTKLRVEGFPVPVTGQKFYWDEETRGFGLRVTANGKRAYIAQGRVNGRTCRVTLGPHGLLTCDEARKRAKEALLGMHDGVDPQDEKLRKKAVGVTLREVSVAYLRDRDLKATSVRDIERHIDKNFTDWADKPAAQITRDAVMRVFRDISKRAPAQASQAFVILRALLNYARAAYRTPDGLPTLPENPVAVLSEARMWNKSRARETRIPNDKIGAVWSMLQSRRIDGHTADDRTSADYISFLLLTGARASEASELTWDRVTLTDDAGSWHLPDPKNRNPVTFPLSAAAREILSARPRIKGNDHVFSSRGTTGRITDPRGITKAISNIAGLALGRHDLRRTFTVVSIQCGIEMWKTELITGHVPQSVTLKHYMETSDLRYLAPEVEMIGQWIVEQGAIADSVAAGTNVIALRA